MSAVKRLLEQLSSLNVDVILCGDKLKINAPKGILTPELIHRIRQSKSEILAATHAHTNIIRSEKDRHHRHHRHDASSPVIPEPLHAAQSQTGWPPEAADLIRWFINEGQHLIPAEPFRLCPWIEITNPKRFGKYLRFTIGLGPDFVTNKNGKLTEDLRMLKGKLTSGSDTE